GRARRRAARDQFSRGVAPTRVACPSRSTGRARRRAAPRSLLAWRGTDARRLSEQIDGAGPEAGRPAITPRVAWHRGASLARADRRGGPEAGRPAITPRVAWAPTRGLSGGSAGRLGGRAASDQSRSGDAQWG